MTYRWQRYLRAHPWAADGAMAFVLLTVTLPGSELALHGVTLPARWPGWVVSVVACAALLSHRRHPRAAAVVTAACTVVLVALGYLLSPLLLAPTIAALFLLAVHESQRTAYAFAAATIAAVAAAGLLLSPPGVEFSTKVLAPSFWLLLPVTAGGSRRLRQAYLDAALDAATTRAEYAERTREDEARHRVGEERLRIAHELHDVLAHHLALANAQAGTVAHLFDRDPDRAKVMAGDLSRTIGAALREMKATVGLLRRADDPPVPVPPEPAPGLDRLPELVESFRVAGLEVAVATEGEPRPLLPWLDLTAYRIIQEALTNVAKHAAGSPARVRLRYPAGRLDIVVTDDGSARPPAAGTDPPGYGIIGMRERAQAVGGRLHAGPRAAGGFEVRAELPLQTGVRAA